MGRMLRAGLGTDSQCQKGNEGEYEMKMTK